MSGRDTLHLDSMLEKLLTSIKKFIEDGIFVTNPDMQIVYPLEGHVHFFIVNYKSATLSDFISLIFFHKVKSSNSFLFMQSIEQISFYWDFLSSYSSKIISFLMFSSLTLLASIYPLSTPLSSMSS